MLRKVFRHPVVVLFALLLSWTTGGADMLLEPQPVGRVSRQAQTEETIQSQIPVHSSGRVSNELHCCSCLFQAQLIEVKDSPTECLLQAFSVQTSQQQPPLHFAKFPLYIFERELLI